MTLWQPWDRAENPEQLADFVQTDVVRLLLPAPLAQRLRASGDGRSPQERAQIIYEVLAEAGIRYVREPATSPTGRQEIRPPDQVLARPKHGTCLDLALVFSGACLDAGLRPVVVVADSADGLASHAVVAVWLGGDWALNDAAESPLSGEVFTTPPHLDSGMLLADTVRATVTGAGEFVAVDVQGLAHVEQASPAPWSEAVRRGYEVIAAMQVPDGKWRWSLGIDVAESRRHRPPLDVPTWLPADRSILAAAFSDSVETGSPLSQLKARSGRVPFLPREELDTLIEWADPITARSDSTEIATQQKVAVRVMTGVGGCGKTHLAAELCRRLSGTGWYTGFIPKHPMPSHDSLHWLTGVVSPVLAVVDYADESSTDDLAGLLKELSGREHPTRVLLTARADGPWLSELVDALQRDSVGVRFDLPMQLARRHDRDGELFARAFRRFAAGPHLEDVSFTQLPQQTNWTTLDVVIQAWLAASGIVASDLPETRRALYDKVLDREFGYWQRALTGQSLALVPTARLAVAGAALTLVAPEPADVADVLERLEPAPAGEPSWGQLGTVLASLLAEPTEGLAVRPDPVGEHLVLRECQRQPDLLDSVLPHPPAPLEESASELRTARFERRAKTVDRELTQATEVISRAAQFDRARALEVAEECLSVRPDMWPQALEHTLRQGGVFASALEVLARRPGSPLPLETLTELPLGHGALRGLALAAVNSLRPATHDHPNETEQALLAAWLNSYAVRLAEVGDRTGALTAIDEAVTHYRSLAEANPAAFLPDLATSLNNQANVRSEVGDPAAALTAIDEAVTHYRSLAEANPSAFLPDLAMSLNNQANRRAEIGDPAGALTAIDEAVTHYRSLTEANPAAFLPDLATSLNNQAAVRSKVGDRDAALTAIDEAVTIRRSLAEANPAAFLPDLATSLNNQAAVRSEVGDRDAALTAIDEAVTHYRSLTEANPAAFLPDLATSLNNQANRRAEIGDRTGALTAIDEAVTHYRSLTEANPAAFLPGLATSLNNQANVRSDVGDPAAALTAIDEAVTHYRSLTEANPSAFLPDLAMSLNNQANRRAEIGDPAGALTAIDEAVTHYRSLTEANPAAFLPDLAGALNNQANVRSKVGDPAAALTAIDEAVTIRRSLAEANPAAFLPDLATSLNNQANVRSEVGDPDAALTAIDEAVTIRRSLTEANPAAFLPDLTMSLNNQANVRSKAGDWFNAVAAFADGWEELSASSRTRLHLARAKWLAPRSTPVVDTDEILIADCQEASVLAAGAAEEVRLVGAARRAVADTVADLTQQRPDLADHFSSVLPGWALNRPDDDFARLCNQWLSAEAWAQREQFLTEHIELFSAPDTRESLGTLRFQYPEVTGLGVLEELLEEVDKHGVEATLTKARSHFTLVEELTDWLETRTWQESERFLTNHRRLLNDSEALPALEAFGDSPLIRQHLGLLALSKLVEIETAFAARGDADTAVSLGNELIEKLNWAALTALLLAAPGLAERPFALTYFRLVLDAAKTRPNTDWTPDPEELKRAYRHATPEQREVAAGRLLRLVRDHPGLPQSISALADALRPTEELQGDASPR